MTDTTRIHRSFLPAFFASATLLLLTTGPARAGEMTDAYPAVDDSAGLINPITGYVSVGYDSTYMFRGSNLGRNAPWAQLNFAVPAGRFAINAGAWYTNPIDPDGAILDQRNDELDLFVTASTTMGIFDVWVGYTAYLYPESGRSFTNEVGIGATTSINFIDFRAAYYHDFDLNTNYYEWSVGKNIDLNESTSINMGVAFGHLSTRNFHSVISAGVDHTLTEKLTVSAYLAYNVVDVNRVATGFKDRLFGGVSVAYSF